MLKFLGKVILVSALLFWAYSLFAHNETANKFNSNLPGVLKLVSAIPPNLVKVITENILYVRYAVVGLLGLSALLILTSSRFITFLVLLGWSIHTAVFANPKYDNSEATLQNFVLHVGIAGALVYLMGISGAQAAKARLSAASAKKTQ